MGNQIRVELYKLRKSLTFYVILAGFFLMSCFYMYLLFLGNVTWDGSVAFLDTISDTSFLFVLTLFISFFIGADFSNRTIENEIRIGCSRWSVILSKSLIAILASILLYFLAYSLPVTVVTGITNGFRTDIPLTAILVRVLVFCIQLAAIESFTVFFAFIFRKSSSGMSASVCFIFVTCNVLRNFFDESNPVFGLTSFCRIMMNNQELSVQDILVSLISAVINLAVVFILTFVCFRKAELK